MPKMLEKQALALRMTMARKAKGTPFTALQAPSLGQLASRGLEERVLLYFDG
jgi:hypothetical protein